MTVLGVMNPLYSLKLAYYPFVAINPFQTDFLLSKTLKIDAIVGKVPARDYPNGIDLVEI
jgi:hypothetical protein